MINCVVYAVTYLLNMSEEEIYNEIGHDGTDVFVDTDHEIGFHMQEILPLFLKRNKALILIEKYPNSALNVEVIEPIYNEDYAEERFKNMIHDQLGLAIGFSENNVPHAWIHRENRLYDYNGSYSIESQNIWEFWMVSDVK